MITKASEYDAYKALKNTIKVQDGFITGPIIRENEQPAPAKDKPFWYWDGKKWVINK